MRTLHFLIAGSVSVALPVALPTATRLPLPTISAVTPRLTFPGTVVTIDGANLKPSGYSVELEYTRKYVSSGQDATVRIPLSGSATQLQFNAPSNMRPNSLRLRYTEVQPVKDQLFSTNIAVPGTVVVADTPTFSSPQTIVVNGQSRLRIGPGALTIKGRNLLTPSVSGASNAPIGTITNTTFSFGSTALTITQAVYDGNIVLPDGTRGADIVTLTIPDLGLSGNAANFTTSAHGGTTFFPSAVYVEAPAITRIEELFGGAARVVSAGQTLLRGREYKIFGTSLSVAVSGAGIVEAGTVTVAGSAQQVTAQSGGSLGFVLQTSASSGTIVVANSGGSVSRGPFPIANPPVSLPLADVVVVPNTAVGGTDLTATISFAGSVPAGGTAGDLTITGDNFVFRDVPLIKPVNANPLVLTIETGGLENDVTSPLTFRISPSSGGTDSLVRTVTLRKLEPTQITLTPSTVAGGQSATARIDFNVPANYHGSIEHTCIPIIANDMEVDVFTSDTIARPADNRRCINEPSETVSITTSVVNSPRTITISARANGVTKTAMLIVEPGRLTSVTSDRPTMVSMQSATGTLTMSAPLAGAAVLLSSSDPALSVPAKLTLGSGLTTTFPITTAPVSSARTVTVTAVVNGISQSMPVTLQPLEITSVAVAPSTVTAGGNTVGTITLNATINLPITVTLSSSDPAVATVPASVSFVANQNAAIFSVQTTAPQTQARTVNITATYSIVTPAGVTVTTTQVGTLTVQP